MKPLFLEVLRVAGELGLVKLGNLSTDGLKIEAENYVYDGDQLVAVLNSAGAITHETFDGPSLDQVFADQTTLSGVLWPLEDRSGSVRDVVNSFLSPPVPPQSVCEFSHVVTRQHRRKRIGGEG